MNYLQKSENLTIWDSHQMENKRPTSRSPIYSEEMPFHVTSIVAILCAKNVQTELSKHFVLLTN